VAEGVVLGLRADTLQETLLHQLARAAGAYDEAGLTVHAVVGRSDDGLDIGLASCLFEVAARTAAWRIEFVGSVAPLFWAAAAEDVPPDLRGRASPTVAQLLRLALLREERDGTEGPTADHVVVGPAGTVAVATGRWEPQVDVGLVARFPAIGLATRPDAHDPHVAARVIAAHRAAIEVLQHDDRLASRVLQQHYGLAAADTTDVLALLRTRFRPVPAGEAATSAGTGLTTLGLDPATLHDTFTTRESTP
jgi:hypothetical protein